MVVAPKRLAALGFALALLGLLQRSGASGAEPPDVLRATLPNGLRVVVVRDTLAPVVTEYVNYLVGGADAPAGFPGMAHAEEHMVAARSNRELSSNQIATITSLLGGDFDADTQNSVTQYFMTTPAQDLDVALRLEAARMRGVLDLPSEWAQERGAIEQEVSRDLSNAFYRYYSKALAVVFARTPYDHDALGTRASFQRTTSAMLKRFYDTWYAPNNAILVVSGNVDPPATLALVRSIFGPLPRRAVPAHAPVKLGAIKGGTIRDVSDFPVPLAALGYRLPGFQSPDYAATQIAMDALASQRSDLSALAYEGKALSTGADYEPLPAAGLAFAYVATAPGGDTDAALKLIDGTLENYRKNGLPSDLVEAAKRKEIAQALFTRNSIEGLAEEWSQALAVQGLTSPDDALARFAAVTTDDVNRVLRAYLVRDRAVVGILTPKPGGAPSTSGGFGVRDTFSSKDQKPVPLPTWAARLATVPPVPPSNLSPVDTKLPNGIRLIVQPEPVSPTVTVQGEIRHNPDLQTPAGKEGVGELLDGLFPYGTVTYDRLSFQRELDAIAADESAGTSFSLAVPSKSFDRGVELLADNLLHPALPQSAFAIVRQQAAQALGGLLKSPDYLAERALVTALVPKDDPTLRQATPESVSALSLDDVKSYLATIYRPDMTTIVIAGDVTTDQAKSVAEKWFGSWSASGPPPKTELPAVPLNAPSTTTVAAPGRSQTTVTLREQLALRRDDPDYYALQLGDAILGGAFYATRFSRDLRKENGLVYAVSAELFADKTRSSYRVTFGSDPDKVTKVRAIIDRDLRDIASKAPSTDEMRQAKIQILRELALSESSVDAIAEGLVRRATASLPLDEPTRRAEAILEVTPEQVRAAFAKWIDPVRFVQVNEGPAPT